MDRRVRDESAESASSTSVRIEELGRLVRRKRRSENLSLEAAALETGVSAATLSRIERRAEAGVVHGSPTTPDLRTVAAVATWLGVSVSGAGFVPAPTASSTPEIVEAHLRADRNLDGPTASLLARMFRAAYEQAAEEQSLGKGHHRSVPTEEGK